MEVNMLEPPWCSHSEHLEHFALQVQPYRFQFEVWQSLGEALVLKP